MTAARQLKAAAAALALLGFTAAPAAGQGGIYNDFQSDGQINACAYSPGQLQNGLNNLPPDLQQYAPGFADQLRAGLEAQCGGGAVPAPGDPNATVVPVLPGGGSGPSQPNSTIPKPPAPKPAAVQRLGDVPAPPVSVVPTGSDPPDGLLPLLAAGGLLLLLALVGILRLSGVSGERLSRPLRAAFADARGRTSDTLATVWDFVRFGR
jgi:hypothetical protein